MKWVRRSFVAVGVVVTAWGAWVYATTSWERAIAREQSWN